MSTVPELADLLMDTHLSLIKKREEIMAAMDEWERIETALANLIGALYSHPDVAIDWDNVDKDSPNRVV